MHKNDVYSALKEELATEALDIHVDVDEDTLTLSGIVDVLQDKLAAERVVQKVAGR